MKTPVDDRENCSAGQSEAGEAKSADEIAYESRILKDSPRQTYHHHSVEIAYETAMQGGSAYDIIHCLDHYASHLSTAQIIQLEMKVEEEALVLLQKRNWGCARDLLSAADKAGVSPLRDANGEKSIGLMIAETYAEGDAMEKSMEKADAISEACAVLKGMSSDQDLAEMKIRLQNIRAQTAHAVTTGRRFYPSASCEVLGDEAKRRPSLRLSPLGKEDTVDLPPSISTVSTVASESLAVFERVSAPAL
jgi:hypothetical protein